MAATISILSSVGGPLFVLRWNGTLCPCLEKTDDRNARKALIFLQNLHVTWLKSHSDNGSKSGGGGGGGMLSGWLGGKERTATGGGGDSCTAKLVFVDSPSSGDPEFQVQPLPDPDAATNSSGLPLLKQSGGYIKTVSLKDCVKVVATTNTITIQGQSKRKSGLPSTLVRFQLIATDDIQEVHDALQELISWEARRQAAIPEEEREVDMDNGLSARAQKAAHFAKREIEMRDQRREREKRKAKYVKDAGGLKYTALAMANRTELT